MNCGSLPIVEIVNLKVKTTGGSSLTRTISTVCGQEATGTSREAEAGNGGLFAGRYLRIGAGNLFEMGLEAADSRHSVGFCGFGL
jgi:hypothetical protein